MKLLINVKSEKITNILIAIQAITESHLAELPEIELEADEYNELMKEVYLLDQPKAMLGAIKGFGTFLGVPIKRK